MNIFVLDTDMRKSAHYTVDKHVVKMITEHNQLLCGVHRFLGHDAPYKKTHINHPCAKWVRESKSNYLWLADYNLELCFEYTSRYDKIHKGLQVTNWALGNIPDIVDVGLTKHALAMPIECMSDDVVASYRNYYIKHKSHIAKWKHNQKPTWWKDQ
jgi:hypothetical protein